MLQLIWVASFLHVLDLTGPLNYGSSGCSHSFISYVEFLREVYNISIYSLRDLGVSNNLTGSLSRIINHYSIP